MSSEQLSWRFYGAADAVARADAIARAAKAPRSSDELLRVVVADAAVARGVVRGAGLAFYLAPGERFALADAPAEDLAFEVLRALPVSSGARRGGIWTATGEAPDAVTVLARTAVDAHTGAGAIFQDVSAAILTAHNPLDDVWEQLSKGAKLASTLKAAGRLEAAVIAWRGRGRIIGPIHGDLLMRFGVSTWR